MARTSRSSVNHPEGGMEGEGRETAGIDLSFASPGALADHGSAQQPLVWERLCCTPIAHNAVHLYPITAQGFSCMGG